MFKYSTGLNKGTAVRLAESIPLCRDNFKFSLKMNTMSAQPGAFQDLEEETGNHLEETIFFFKIWGLGLIKLEGAN